MDDADKATNTMDMPLDFTLVLQPDLHITLQLKKLQKELLC
jgi:hypothetical protein